MNNPSNRHSALLLTAFCLLSAVMGLLIGVVNPKWILAGALGAVAVCLVFYDYRFGVFCLTLLLPWSYSKLLPATKGFNLINLLVFATAAAFVIQRSFRRTPTVPLPKVVWLGYLLLVVIAAAVAWPHLSIGAMNFPVGRMDDGQAFAPANFLTWMIVKPLFFVVYAFMLANAVKDSKKPELFFIALGVSAVLPALAIIGAVAQGGDVMRRDRFLSDLGLHVNEFGMLLAIASGPLLFICSGAGSRMARIASAAAFGIVSMGLLLTASRGAAMAYMVVVAAWLIRRRKPMDLLVGIILAAGLLLVLPAQVQERLTLGLQDAVSTNHSDMNDKLTMGRVAIWNLLAPEVLDSPLWGKGISATAWNAATTAGRYRATHPHNMYLEVLLDIGLLGFAVLAYTYYRYARQFFVLSRQSTLAPVVRDYFAGAFASFFGMLFFASSNGHWMPHPEQTFWWFALGFAFSYWSLGQRSATQQQARKPVVIGARRPVPGRSVY